MARERRGKLRRDTSLLEFYDMGPDNKPVLRYGFGNEMLLVVDELLIRFIPTEATASE